MDSPFANRLNTNYAPTDSEIKLIKDLLVQPQREVARISQEISRLKALITELTVERQTFRAYIDAHEVLISPVRRVPRDVLEEVFLACLPTRHNAVMSSSAAPMVLGRVCSAWRNIAYSTPRLWASLHIPVLTTLRGVSGTTSKYRQKLAQRNEAIKAWLDRSGHCPLSISVFASSIGVEKLALDDLMDILFSVSSRWLEIRLQLPSPDLQRLRTLSLSDIQVLQKIELLATPFTNHGDDLDQQPLYFLAAPSIRTAALCLDRSLPSTLLPVSWDHLTELSLVANDSSSGATCLQTADAMHVLSRCVNLQTCCLMIAGLGPWNAEAFPIPQSITLAFLETFSISDMDGLDIVTFFDGFELPRLRSFRYRCIHDRPFSPDFCHSFSSLAARSPSLECLDFDTYPFPSVASIITVLKPLSSLKQLRLQDVSPGGTWPPGLRGPLMDDDLLAQLATSSNDPVCPILTNITFDYCSAMSERKLLEFIQARAALTHAGGKHLERVDVRFHRDADEDILPRLESLISSGLHVSIRYSPRLRLWASPWEGLQVSEFRSIWETDDLDWW